MVRAFTKSGPAMVVRLSAWPRWAGVEVRLGTPAKSRGSEPEVGERRARGGLQKSVTVLQIVGGFTARTPDRGP